MPEDPSEGNSRQPAWIDEQVIGMRGLKLFVKEYAALLTEDDQLTIAVLRSHLIVEHFIERYLAASNPSVRKWEDARLTFAQKLALIGPPAAGGVLDAIMDGIRCLNKLRNNLVHKLEAAPLPDDLRSMREFISVWRSKFQTDPVPEGVGGELLLSPAIG